MMGFFDKLKQLDLLFLLLDFMPVVLVGAVLFVVRRKHRR